MILELAVTLKPEEMKVMCSEYKPPRFVKQQNAHRFSMSLCYSDLSSVRPSGKASLNSGDSAKLNPEII